MLEKLKPFLTHLVAKEFEDTFSNEKNICPGESECEMVETSPHKTAKDIDEFVCQSCPLYSTKKNRVALEAEWQSLEIWSMKIYDIYLQHLTGYPVPASQIDCLAFNGLVLLTAIKNEYATKQRNLLMSYQKHIAERLGVRFI